MSSKLKIFLISLGCVKNLVDSEYMLGLLGNNNFSIVTSLDAADVAVINTCGFIRSAVEESIATILDVAAKKNEGKLKRLFVTGCFVQRYGYKLKKEMPEVDGWLGTGEIHRITELLEGKPGQSPAFFISRPTYLADHFTPRMQSTPFYSAYLKIAEGCSNKCSFCNIPGLRGPYRSRNLKSLIIEAEKMVELGVKEFNLIAQDTTMYGRDLEENIQLEDLLEMLLHISGIEWIRVLYCHPHRVSDYLLDLMDKEEVICPYIDIPLQHINEGILKSMGRLSNQENPWQLIDRIRSKNRRLSLRTTLMVGFPEETDDVFEELYHFVEVTEFDHVGVFIFSREKGTRAARLKGHMEREVSEKRVDAIMNLQAGIAMKKNRKLVGQINPVLIEGISQETDFLLKGRTATMAPDVDGQVLINKGQGIPGEIMPVLFNEAHPYDLIGEIIQ